MKSIAFLFLTFCITNIYGQEFKASYEILKQEMDKKESKEAIENSVYWQQSTSSLARFSSLGHGTITTFDTRYEGVVGTPFLYDDWQKGAVLIGNTTDALPVMLNYDCVNGQLVIRMDDGSPASLPVEHVRAFIIMDSAAPDSLVFFVSDLNEKGSKSFFQVLYNEKTILYQYLKKHFKAADYQRAYNPNRRFDSFEWDNQLYIKQNSGSLQKVRLNSKAITNLLNDKSPQLKGYITEHNLRFNDTGDLISLLRFYDTL